MPEAGRAQRRSKSRTSSKPISVFIPAKSCSVPGRAYRPRGASHAAGFAAGTALAALREARVAVPGDISVVGMDGIGPARQPPYRLTTVTQPLQAMVARGLDLLAARIGGAALPRERVLLQGALIRGRSARLPADGTEQGREDRAAIPIPAPPRARRGTAP